MSRTTRIVAAALLLGATLASPIFGAAGTAVFASATPAPEDTDDPRAAVKATAGTISGTVTKVDYQKSRITIQTSRGVVDVTVLPSTTIQGRSGFSEISDIAKGQKLTVFLSEKGDDKFAQIIQLQK